MRIRKNAKISTLIYTTANASNVGDESLLQKNLCQLNQSPWDVITFPPSDSSSSFYQFDDNEVYYNVNLAGNGSSFDSVGDFESLASVRTFKGENYDFEAPKTSYEEILRFEDGEMSGIQKETVLCGERDKEGWQCGRVVKDGDTVCDHHIIDLQNDVVWTTKKKCGPVHESRATRARQKTKKRESTSPYEFYYYSGFGPSWGKKRGSTGTTSNVYNDEASQASEVKEMNLNDYDMDLREERMLEPEMSKMELDHIDEDDDDNKNGKKVTIGKKRGRKPIKARSLKSLM